MIRCQSCGNGNPESSRFCDECGARLREDDIHKTDLPAERPLTFETPSLQGASVTSVGIPPMVESLARPVSQSNGNGSGPLASVRASLTVERGDVAGGEFILDRDESNIGRWDADNGIFPDVDLDSHDQEAKVSRRHARVLRRDGEFFVEDLGSTNGTYVNRGRRLLPGNPQSLVDGDEIIVGKTFLRFHII
ncbi:MAG: FHA domain-containing protein [Acidobacteriota bacterium]